MSTYFFEFEAFGEIADLLVMKEPAQHLLIDISNDPPGHESTAMRKYPSRVAFIVEDAALINEILQTASKGDSVKIKGTFRQSGYVPYRTTSIDTVFDVLTFELVDKCEVPVVPRQNAIAEHRI